MMRVTRLIAWNRSPDMGGLVLAGDSCEMPDDLAVAHIRNGDAIAYVVPDATSTDAPDAGESVGDEKDSSEDAPASRPTIDDVGALRRKADALEMAKSLGIDIDPADKLEDMRAALALALESSTEDAPDAGESVDEKG